MSFVHDDPEFDELVRIVAGKRGLSLALVEKDYWVTHALWAIHEQGFDVVLKGGTSLSKGFGLIERFSEDLDLKLDPGTFVELPKVEEWHRTGARATAARKAYFEVLARELRVAGTEVRLDTERVDRHWRAADLEVRYPGRHVDTLGADMKPYVLLEVGSARVVPSVACDLTSFIHDELEVLGQLSDYVPNRPQAVRCLHPLVTLLEKLDALSRRAVRADVEPAKYVRHYEDAARIASADDLPELPDHGSTRDLAEEMVERGQMRTIPSAADPALHLDRLEHAHEIQVAHDRIGHAYWGPRISLAEAGSILRSWIEAELAS